MKRIVFTENARDTKASIVCIQLYNFSVQLDYLGFMIEQLYSTFGCACILLANILYYLFIFTIMSCTQI